MRVGSGCAEVEKASFYLGGGFFYRLTWLIDDFGYLVCLTDIQSKMLIKLISM